MSAFEKIEERPNVEEWHSKEDDCCPLDATVLYYNKSNAKITSDDVDLGFNDRMDTSVYVTSKQLVLWNDELKKGITVAYPNIALHAVQMDPAEGVYVQLKGPGEGEDGELIDFSIVPVLEDKIEKKSDSTSASNNKDTSSSSSDEEAPADPSVSGETHKLYDAISACQELHPDIDESDEDQENPDSTKDDHQWITAENAQDGADIDVPTGIEIPDILETKTNEPSNHETAAPATGSVNGKTSRSPLSDDSEAPQAKVQKT